MADFLSPSANHELGQSFFENTNMMVLADGSPFPWASDYDFLSKKWRELADKPDKTPADIEKIDRTYKNDVQELADSCILYMSGILKKYEFTFNFEDYKEVLKLTNSIAVPNESGDLNEYNKKIALEFSRIANHGEAEGDNIIDRKDWAAYIYALDMKTQHDDNKNLSGFTLNGKITKMNFAMAFNQLKQEGEDNMFCFKLREGYRNLFG